MGYSKWLWLRSAYALEITRGDVLKTFICAEQRDLCCYSNTFFIFGDGGDEILLVDVAIRIVRVLKGFAFRLSLRETTSKRLRFFGHDGFEVVKARWLV